MAKLQIVKHLDPKDPALLPGKCVVNPRHIAAIVPQVIGGQKVQVILLLNGLQITTLDAIEELKGLEC